MTPIREQKRKWLAALLLVVALVLLWLARLGGDGADRNELAASGPAAEVPEAAGELEYRPPPVVEDPDAEPPSSEMATEPVARVEVSPKLGGVTRTAQLVVTVLDAHQGDPVVGAMVTARWAERRRWDSVSRSVGELGEAPHTDYSGVAKLEVPADRRLDVDVLSSGGGFKRESFDVEALSPGVVRELTARVESKSDARFHARVVAAEDGVPIAGAEVRLGRGNVTQYVDGRRQEMGIARFPSATTDRSGCFDLSYLRRNAHTVTISAAGRAPTTVTLGHLSTSPEKRHEVRLSRGARLEGIVTGSLGLPGGLNVRVQALPGHRSTTPQGGWMGHVGSGGAFAIDGLPADQPLLVDILTGDLSLVRSEPAPMTFAPGEIRRVDWQLGSGATVQGQVIGEGGVPGAERLVVLIPVSMVPRDPLDDQLLGSTLRPETLSGGAFEGVRRTTSDLQGRFAFSGVAAGEWALAADGGPTSVSMITRLTIVPSDVAVEVSVQLRDGEFISGRVLDTSGKGVPHAEVTAKGPVDGGGESARCDEAGEFKIGPLLPGRYELRAREFTLFGRSEQKLSAALAEVDSGTSDVVLQLSATPAKPPPKNAASAPSSGGF